MIKNIHSQSTSTCNSHLNWDICCEMINSVLIEFCSHTYDLHEHKSRIKKLFGENKNSHCVRVNSDFGKSIILLGKN